MACATAVLARAGVTRGAKQPLTPKWTLWVCAAPIVLVFCRAHREPRAVLSSSPEGALSGRRLLSLERLLKWQIRRASRINFDFQGITPRWRVKRIFRAHGARTNKARTCGRPAPRRSRAPSRPWTDPTCLSEIRGPTTNQVRDPAFAVVFRPRPTDGTETWSAGNQLSANIRSPRLSSRGRPLSGRVRTF